VALRSRRRVLSHLKILLPSRLGILRFHQAAMTKMARRVKRETTAVL